MLVCLISLAVFLSLAMAGASALATRTGRSGLVDAIWSFSVGLGCLAASLWPLFPGDLTARRWLVAAMAAAWSARLGFYIVRRRHAGGDDPRYADLKQSWGDDAPRQMFIFLQIQAVAAWPLVGAALLAAHSPAPSLELQDALATLVFAVGLIGEAIADRQMANFRADPGNRGRICEDGLWAWSRHPNYFFEWVCWLGYALMAADLGGRSPWGWLAFAAPATMYVLLAHVSGVPPLDKHLARSRPEAFADYSRRVGAFWPRPPSARA